MGDDVNYELERSRRKVAALCHILFRQYPEETAPTLVYHTCSGSVFEICTSIRGNVERVKECWIIWKSWLFLHTHLILIAVGGGSRK